VTLVHERRGAGEPLVLIHGVGSRWQIWEPVLDRLAAAHDVIAIDLPGFGRSPADGTEPTIEGQATRVERFFEEAGVERPHVAGNSMGGAIALELARRRSVQSATAVSPAGFWTDRELAFCQASLRASKAALRLLRPAIPALVATGPTRTALYSQLFARPWRLEVEAARGHAEALLDAASFDAALDAFSRYRFQRPEELDGVPVTIAWGDRDRLLIPRQALRARRLLPEAAHVTLQGLGHVPFSDDPEACARVLLAGAS
jgi:pimeloyl-ACP methyl ester carboxylesterase